MKKGLIGALIILALAGWTGYELIFGPNVLTKKQVIRVVPGTTLDGLTAEIRPYVRQTIGFRLAARLKGFRKPKPGRYVIFRGMSNNTLINMFRSGRQKPVNVTFNNIPDLPHLAGKISRRIYPDSSDLLKVMADTDFLHAKGFTRENALLMYVPNTYQLYYFTTPQRFRDRMYREYRRFWNASRRALADSLGLSPVEVGILASIVQKETNAPAEYGKIARVYLNRLKQNMRLQADPTVVYAYQRETGDTTMIRRVLKKHLAVESPYNTYKYAGLPPGPICMPDVRTVDSVLHAPRHKYYYFSADPDHPGRHLFARTLKAHNQNARKYRQALNKRKIYH